MLRRRLVVFLVLALTAGLYGLIAPPSAVAGFEPNAQSAGIITGPGAGGGPNVRVFDITGTMGASFFAYSAAFRGGVHVAAADVDGDGTGSGERTGWGSGVTTTVGGHCRDDFPESSTATDEIVTGAGEGGGPHVRVFNVTQDSADHTDMTISSSGISFFAYPAAFRGGVRVAGGDLDKDGCDEIVTGAGPGGGPHVKVFDARLISSATPTLTGGVSLQSSFFAFSQAYDGGVWVGVTHEDWEDHEGSCGTIAADGAQPSDSQGCNAGIILAGAGADGASMIRGFTRSGGLMYQVHNYSRGQNPTGAVKVSGRENGHWSTRVVTGTGAGGSDPLVRILSSAAGPTNLLFAYNPDFGSGVNVGIVPAAAGGYILTGPGPGSGPHVKAWSALTDSFEGVGPVATSFMAYNRSFRGGVFVDGGELFADCDESNAPC